MTKNEIKKQIQEELARRDYLDYCRLTNGKQWVVGKHIKYISEILEDFMQGEKRILTLSIPPQHGKSVFITETIASYEAMKNAKRVILASYGDDLARRFGRRNRMKMKEYGHIFGVGLVKESDTDVELSNGGTMISRGIMSGITGQPADLIVIDDPIKNRQEADSETYRERLWEEFLNSLYTRLSADGKIILIMTRWHEDDLCGRLHNNMECVDVNIPLEAELDDVLGRTQGESLFPEIGKDGEWLKEFKRVYTTEQGIRAWNALMQGRPSSAEGNLFKRSYWQRYSVTDNVLKNLPLIILSVDATFKDSKNSDNVALGVWGKLGAKHYYIDGYKKRMDFVETIEAIRQMIYKYPGISAKYIEDKANGSAIISVLNREIGGFIGINPQGSKEARAQAVLPYIESGNVYLPYSNFADELIEEAASFPRGKHDDDVDQMTQALYQLIYRSAELPHEIYDDPYFISQYQYEQTKGMRPVKFKRR